MKATLELAKEQKQNCIFYRYNIDDTLVWFEQYQNSGNIYMVYVRPGGDIETDFQFNVKGCSEDDYYYPKFVEIHTYHEILNVDQTDEYINKLKHAKSVVEAIMQIFENGVHKELYESLHNKM